MNDSNLNVLVPSTVPPDIAPGDRVRIVGKIVAHDETWLAPAEGEVISVHSEPTGAWFAGQKYAHLWLMRLVLRKDDGELHSLVVDQNTQVDLLKKGEWSDTIAEELDWALPPSPRDNSPVGDLR